jgi:hypothetical protein
LQATQRTRCCESIARGPLTSVSPACPPAAGRVGATHTKLSLKRRAQRPMLASNEGGSHSWRFRIALTKAQLAYCWQGEWPSSRHPWLRLRPTGRGRSLGHEAPPGRILELAEEVA